MAAAGSTTAAVYKVGDSAGWTFDQNYDQWVSSKKFQVGDTLVFNYDPQLHNVKQVNVDDYIACTDKAPIASFNSGHDSINLPTPGDYFFLCGIQGHCDIGLKVHVKIAAPTSPPVAPTTPATPTSPSNPVTPVTPTTPTSPSNPNTPTNNSSPATALSPPVNSVEYPYFPGFPVNYNYTGDATTCYSSKWFPISMVLPLFLVLCLWELMV
ncbi:blue copper protein-like [Nicotiana sylvestris]|uniref:Blue copper protein-like n=1 Tax=Nicotiana sylvestris TaxID=4096 RepID=A0A1U7YHH4_NICSY|nr:PREDICTED: blue copper protein-like [Nicotiana sylvestris]